MKKFLSVLLCVCLMFTTVMAVPSVSAEEQAKEYDYIACDYENLADVDTETWFGKADAVTASLETTAPIDGTASLRISKNATGYGGFSVFPDDVALKAGTYYRVTATAQVQSGSFNLGRLGNMGSKADGTYNWTHIHTNSAYTGESDNGGTPLVLWTQWVEKGASAAFTKQGTIKVSENTQFSHLGMAVYAKTLDATTNEASILIDNVVAAEIIDTVAAVNSDETKGTVAVANKNESYTDYAMNEIAVFTATPADGYSFAGWYNGDALVSTDATYEHTLTGDTTLTAKWKLYEKEYDYKAYDYEDGFFGDSFPYTGISTSTSVVSEETTAPISGASSYKYQFGATGTKWAFLTPKTAENKLILGASYRVSGNYKAVQTTAGVISMNIGAVDGNSKLHKTEYANARIRIVNGIAATKKFIGTITTVDAGYPAIYGYSNATDAANDYILLDDIVYAEIIDTVAAVNSDEAKGTVAVANKNESYTDYAMNEVAVFTATPAEGYSFKGWYDREDNLVSTSATYEHTLVTDTTLTAKWKLYEKEYDYKAYDYEDGFFGDSFPYDGIVNTYSKGAEGAVTSVVSEETENPVAGASSYKYFFGNGDTNWAFLTPKTAENKLISGATYRVSGKYAVQQNNIAVVALAFGGATGHFQTNSQDASARVQGLNGKYESGSVYSFNGKITTVNAGYPAMHGYTKGDYTTDYVLLDDIVYAQIIDTVSATSANTSMGSATVVNKAGYQDYAKNEVAVFTAVPVNGYYFEGWYDANGELVSTDKVYEATLTTDTNLTAKFLAYDTLYNISFVTNGGNEIESISNGEGADIVMPENPVKDGYVFAGWYTDEALANPFTAKVFSAEDITLYAKWANSYQDFENYEGTPSGNFEVLTDGENAYLGNGYLKYSADAKDSGSRVVVSNEALKDFAFPGDKIRISFKYKLLSGDARFYMHTSSRTTVPTLTKTETDTWLNAYKHQNVNLTVSEDWQELSVTYDLKSYSEITAIGATLDDFLYTVLIFSSENGAEFYIDDIALDVIPGIKVKTAYNNAAALRSAAASSTGKNGVRIYNEIDTHWVAEKNIVEYGSVAAFASNIEGEITLDNGRKGVAYSAADGISSVWEVTEHTVVFTSYLTNIAASKYNEDILIRSYAIAADGTVYYGSTATVSVFEVANAIDNANTADGSEPTEEDANAFYTFVTEANSAAYASWCAENEKTLGALYNGKYSA